MATNTFDRRILISDSESLERLTRVMADNTPKKPISEHPFSSDESAMDTVLITLSLHDALPI